MSQNETVENAIRQIDGYINEALLRPSDGQPPSPSRRLQALGQQKVGSFTRLLDFQNEQSVQEITAPLLPNEFWIKKHPGGLSQAGCSLLIVHTRCDAWVDASRRFSPPLRTCRHNLHGRRTG